MNGLVRNAVAMGLALQMTALAADPQRVQLRWEDLGGMVTGNRVSVRTADKTVKKGRVTSVNADAIVLDSGSVDRAMVEEIRLVEYVGNGRYRGKLIGGTSGLVLGLTSAAAIGMKEGSAHRTGDKAAAIVLGIGGFPLGMLAGYFIGKRIDREVTIIRIIPVK